MYFVSTIVKKIEVRNYLNKHFDIEKLRTVSPDEAKPVFTKMQGVFGIIAEQLILINSYKKSVRVNRAINDSIKMHVSRIKKLRTKINNDLNTIEINRWGSSNASTAIFYNNKNSLENDPHYRYYTQFNIAIKTIKPFEFIENINKFEFQYENGTQTYFIDYHLFYDFAKNCLYMLEKNVYSKQNLSNHETARLLLFENIMVYHPIYLIGSLCPYQQNIHKLFLDYNDQINAVCKMIEVNTENINNAGKLIAYQYSCSYKTIRGRVDFVTNKSILEIKIVSKLSIQDFYQILIYALISRTEEASHLNHIKFITILNPNMGKSYTFDINLITKEISQNPKIILDGLISVLESQN